MLKQNKNKTTFILLTIGLIAGFVLIVTATMACKTDDKYHGSVISISSSSDQEIRALNNEIKKLRKRIKKLENDKAITENKRPLFDRFGRKNSWDPFEEMERMQNEMDKLFQESFRYGGATSHGMFSNDMLFDNDFEIKEEKDKYLIEIETSGVKQGNVDIQVKEHSITITGEYEQVIKKNKNMTSKNYRTFSKTIPIPHDADVMAMETTNQKNKMIIILPKKSNKKETHI